MKRNIGRTDTFIRILLAAALFTAGLIYDSWWGLLGIIPLATAAAGKCMLYKLIGVNTRHTSGEGKIKQA